ncbi:succinylglutamate desuccinylase/aspartoacylase family protein [bacterium]|nr:succinylglutamate desuccinylase/aspartoacylase family protein [bacterium]
MIAARMIPLSLLAFAALAAAAAAPAAAQIPEDRKALTRTISYAEMKSFLASIDGVGPVRVSEEAKTAEGRSVFLVHAARGKAPSFRVLFFAQQHGDEVSGKDALLYLLRDVARRPETLPADVDLWVMPMVNPDGAEAGKRRTSTGADLNRDHMVLENPETQALHRVARRVRPHVAVDCHEFGRDTDRDQGFNSWAEITMDNLNNPLFDPAVVAAASRWVEEGAAAERAAGHNFLRYTVGGLPPRENQRHSAPEADSAVNSMGMYGGMAFIVEAGVRRADDGHASDLASRVDAYLVLLKRFLAPNPHRAADVAAIEAARRKPLPPFLPTNYLWVNRGTTITEFPLIETATGKTVRIPTANMMTEVAVKSAVATPVGYAVEPRAAAAFKTLFARHEIPFEELAAPRGVAAERCTLVRMEDEFDEVYSRYDGRQIVTCAAAKEETLPAGTLLVTLRGEAATRAALLLEPAALYGVYQYPRFRPFAVAGAALPVLRVTR